MTTTQTKPRFDSLNMFSLQEQAKYDQYQAQRREYLAARQRYFDGLKEGRMIHTTLNYWLDCCDLDSSVELMKFHTSSWELFYKCIDELEAWINNNPNLPYTLESDNMDSIILTNKGD